MTTNQISKALDSIIAKWMTANPESLLTEEQLFDDYRCGQLLLTDSEENALLTVMGE